MIKYLGSKRQFIDQLLDVSRVIPSSCLDDKRENAGPLLDVFSGTCRVAYAFKKQGVSAISNDLAHYAQTFGLCYLEAHKETHEEEATDIIRELNGLKGQAGYVTETFCTKSRFFTPKNGERIDAIRDLIESRNYPQPLKAVLVTSLIEAADAVDSTCGVQMAYLKQYAARALKDIELKVPQLLPKVEGCKAYQMDAKDIGKTVGHVDIAYFDPPYNQHSYLGNYHVWESISLWDKPEVYGVACKRVDVKDRKSDFNSKKGIYNALKETVENIDANTYIVSFNNEGYLTRADIEKILQPIGQVSVTETDYKRYIGAKIGIHNKKGEVVGKVSHTENKELIFIVQRK